MKGRYVIFADDDADDLELITGYFKQYNQDITVLEFKDGVEVLKFLDDFAHHSSLPLLIVLDINMPRMNGKETLASLRAHRAYRNIPVVMYTTSSSDVDERWCRSLGASWVNKPSSMDQIKKVGRIIAEFCHLPF